MAMKVDWNCPICQEGIDNVAYVTSCCHRFCLGCIVQWIKTNPSCPLCRQPVESIIYSVGFENKFLETALPQPSDSLASGHWAEQGAVGPVPRAYVAGFLPETWALLFQNNREVLERGQIWLNEVLYADCSWDVVFAKGKIIATLCLYGLNEEVLVQELLPLLGEQAVMFVHQLIDVAVNQCSEQVLRQMEPQGFYAAEEHSPTANGPVASPEGMATTNVSMQEEPHEELEQLVAGTSNAGQSRNCLCRGPHHCLTKRASCSQDPPAHKKPCHRQF